MSFLLSTPSAPAPPPPPPAPPILASNQVSQAGGAQRAAAAAAGGMGFQGTLASSPQGAQPTGTTAGGKALTGQ